MPLALEEYIHYRLQDMLEDKGYMLPERVFMAMAADVIERIRWEGWEIDPPVQKSGDEAKTDAK